MIVKVRENLYLADAKVTKEELEKIKATVVEVVCEDQLKLSLPANVVFYQVGLSIKKVNRPHVKDIACHIPKYMMQNGETVVVVGKTGMIRGAFVCARAVCELESSTIYEVLLEMEKLIKGLKIGEAYL